MTPKQYELISHINHQRKVVKEFDDVVEHAILESLFVDLRNTFQVVPTDPHTQHVQSPSRAQLRLIV